MDTWFTTLDFFLRSVLTRYKIPLIPPISALLISVGERMARSSRVYVLEKDLGTALDGVSETTARLYAANKKFLVLEARLSTQKKDVDLLTTELENANARNVELDRELQTKPKDLTIAQVAAKGAIKYVYAIQGAVSNMTRQMDDVVRTVDEAVRRSVDGIHIPSVTTLSSAIGGVQSTGANNTATRTDSPTGVPSTAVDERAA